jgi:dCMP deaminase
MRTLVAYVPVLHEGYRRFFEKNAEAKEVYIFGPEILAEFSWLAKEIRQLDPELMRTAIESLGIFEKVTVLTIAGAESLNKAGLEIILPDEDVSRTLATNYLSNASVTFDTIFLRWDKRNSIAEKPVASKEFITHDELRRTVMKDLAVEAERSSDFWRHVGAAIVKDEEVLFVAHNQHLPSEHSPYVHGDPRNNFHKGGHIEISTAFHAEVSLIAEAARKGIALEGADMYVTVFPCPPCAKAIAFSGIKWVLCT